MDRVGDREGKMEKYCSTGQSPQRAVALTEEEEEDSSDKRTVDNSSNNRVGN